MSNAPHHHFDKADIATLLKCEHAVCFTSRASELEILTILRNKFGILILPFMRYSQSHGYSEESSELIDPTWSGDDAQAYLNAGVPNSEILTATSAISDNAFLQKFDTMDIDPDDNELLRGLKWYVSSEFENTALIFRFDSVCSKASVNSLLLKNNILMFSFSSNGTLFQD